MKTLRDPLLEAECRLKQIEQDPNSFTPGRRNDDVVNWFLTKKLIEVLTPGGPDRRPVHEYLDEFALLKKTSGQTNSLRDWNYDGMSAERKIRVLWQHYGIITNASTLESYLISIHYRSVKTSV